MIRASIIIPFYLRHANLERALRALALQTTRDLEVVVAAFEPDDALERLCAAHAFAVIVPVGGLRWNVAAARNAGIRAARGTLLIFLDADIVVRPEFICSHLACHAGASGPCLSVGRVLGFFPYGEPMSVEAERLLSADTAELLSCAEHTLPSDARWGRERGCALPWAFCWSGNIGIRGEALRRNRLYFDEDFCGWGGEDLEWAYRAHRAGHRVQFCPEAWGVHLLHERNLSGQITSEQENFRRFLQLHPRFEVEVLVWLNDLEANRRYCEIVSSVADARGAPPLDRDRPLQLAVSKDRVRFGADKTFAGEAAFNLLGVATPFPSSSFAETTIAPWMQKLPSGLLEPIQKEALRLRSIA